MKENFIPESDSSNQEKLEAIQQTFTTSSNLQVTSPGLDSTVLYCCKAFLNHKPVLLSKVYKIFNTCKFSRKRGCKLKIASQKNHKYFDKPLKIITDENKRLGTVMKGIDNNDDKLIHKYLYDSITEENSLPNP